MGDRGVGVAVALKKKLWWQNILITVLESSVRCRNRSLYRGADKSLARPGRKQATVTKL